MSALRLNVSGLLKETAGAARDYTVDVGPDELGGLLEDARPAAPLQGELRLMRTPRSVFVRGSLSTRLAIECSRCLDEVEVPATVEVEAEFFPEVDITTGQSLPAPDDDLAFTIDGNHELDLQEVVRQTLLLGLPMQTLCSESCEGLCAECGQNLNEASCEHAGQEPDERVASLAAAFRRAREN